MMYNIIIENCHVITCNDKNDILENVCICIISDEIVYIGKKNWDDSYQLSENVLDLSNQIVMPGLIDAHFHTAQQLMSGLVYTDETLLEPVWKNYLIPFESTLTSDDVYISSMHAYINLLKNGTTCFAEAGGPYADIMGLAAERLGIRGFVAYSVIDSDASIGSSIPVNMSASIDEIMFKTNELCDRFCGPLVQGYSALRQIITCSKDLIIEMHKFAKNKKVKLHTHLSEGRYEIDYALEKFGKRSVFYLNDLGVLDESLHCAHSVLVNAKEITLMCDSGLSVVHCPYNNYSIGFPEILTMQERGIIVSIGTDGIFSAGNIDMFRVSQALVISQACINSVHYDRYPIAFSKIMKMLTIDGARALGIDKQVGSIEVGKKADIISIDVDNINSPAFIKNPYSIFGAATGQNVSNVIVNGIPRIIDYELVDKSIKNEIKDMNLSINSISKRVFSL